VVHQHVELPVGLDRGCDQTNAICFAAYVGLDEARRAAGLPDPADRFFVRLGRAIRDDDPGGFAGEQLGGGAADAGPGPGHDGHLLRDSIFARSIADGSGLAHRAFSECRFSADTEMPEKPRGLSGIRANWRSKLAGHRLAAITL